MSAADYDALGLIRTNELLRADEYYGVDQQYWEASPITASQRRWRRP